MLLFLLKIKKKKKVKCYKCGGPHYRNKCPEFKKAKSNEEFTVEKVSCNVLEDKDGSANRDEFLIDSGATLHVVNDKKWLCNIEACNIYLTSIDGGNFYKTRGDVYLSNGVVLKQVVLATSLPRNIISVSRVNNDNNLKATFTHKGCQVTKNDKIVISAELRNMLYFAKFTFTIKEEVHSMIDLDDNYIINKEDEEDDWLQKHTELGHASKNQMKTLGIKNPNGTKCFTCMSMVNKTKGGTDNHDYNVGELIHTDLVGPMYNEYAIVSVDHKSKVIFSYILQSKNEASDKAIATIKTFNNLLKQQDKSNCYVRPDNEFNTRKLNDYCQQTGLILQLTAPHSSHQNGNAENANGYLKRKVRILLEESGLDESFWKHAFMHAVFLNNYLPRNNNKLSPWAMLN